MRKISVSIPTFEWQREGIWGSEEMQCKGKVARMHKKSLSESDGKVSRKPLVNISEVECCNSQFKIFKFNYLYLRLDLVF